MNRGESSLIVTPRAFMLKHHIESEKFTEFSLIITIDWFQVLTDTGVPFKYQLFILELLRFSAALFITEFSNLLNINLIRDPLTAGDLSEIFKILLVLVRSEIWKFFLVLVRSGFEPRTNRFRSVDPWITIWAGPKAVSGLKLRFKNRFRMKSGSGQISQHGDAVKGQYNICQNLI